jgi:hypothetical protein
VSGRGRPAGLLVIASLAACRLVDAAGGDPPADATACETVPQVTDDFEDGVTAADWTTYADAGAAFEEADGVLRILYSGVDEAWAGYVTARPHDLRGGWLAAEVARVGGQTILELNAGDTKVQTYAEGSTIFGTVIVAGDTVSEFETDYVPETHVHWRMREEAGIIHWETSPDGAAWSEMDARPTPIAADAVTLLVSGGGVDGDDPAEFESVEIAAADCPQSLR